MKIFVMGVMFALVLLAIPVAVSAQVDNFGVIDTVYAEVTKIDDFNWSITVNYSNDETVIGLAVPLKLSAGANRVVADSAVYTGGRIQHFAYKGFRPDTTIQSVLLGMIANLGPSQNELAPGHGRLVTVFVSSMDKKPIEKLAVDTTTLTPNNSLMVVAHKKELEKLPKRDNTNKPDKRVEIYPAFVVQYSK